MIAPCVSAGKGRVRTQKAALCNLERRPTRLQPCWHLDLGLLVFKLGENKSLLFKPPISGPLFGSLSRLLQEDSVLDRAKRTPVGTRFPPKRDSLTVVLSVRIQVSKA